MKIYDISQEVLGCVVYPGDPAPKATAVANIEEGSLYNLTKFEMCAHNGTHIDAPYHFYQDGKTVDQMSLEKTVGWCYVAEFDGELTKSAAEEIFAQAEREHPQSQKKLLFKGKTTVTEESAAYFAAQGVELLGVESQTVGPEDAPMAVHKVLLEREIVLLEGIRLKDVPEGVYLLSPAPLCIAGAEGSPCRAMLVDLEGERC